MIVILMGVSGSGKTTIGKLLAESLHWQFSDADDFHSPANLEKMSHNLPLTDSDRAPWLNSLRTAIQQWLENQQNVVLACSALKETYRQILTVDSEQLHWVYLKGSFAMLKARLEQRLAHYMKSDMLRSQLDILEEPQDALIVNITLPLDMIIQDIKTQLEI